MKKFKKITVIIIGIILLTSCKYKSKEQSDFSILPKEFENIQDIKSDEESVVSEKSVESEKLIEIEESIQEDFKEDIIDKNYVDNFDYSSYLNKIWVDKEIQINETLIKPENEKVLFLSINIANIENGRLYGVFKFVFENVGFSYLNPDSTKKYNYNEDINLIGTVKNGIAKCIFDDGRGLITINFLENSEIKAIVEHLDNDERTNLSIKGTSILIPYNIDLYYKILEEKGERFAIKEFGEDYEQDVSYKFEYENISNVYKFEISEELSFDTLLDYYGEVRVIVGDYVPPLTQIESEIFIIDKNNCVLNNFKIFHYGYSATSNIENIVIEDFNNDGLEDIKITFYESSKESFETIYYQSEYGIFYRQ